MVREALEAPEQNRLWSLFLVAYLFGKALLLKTSSTLVVGHKKQKQNKKTS